MFFLILPFLLFAYVVACCLLPPLLQRPAPAPGPAMTRPARGERIRLIDGNGEALSWRLKLIFNARREILLTSFDLRDDETGLDVLSALLDAAERGVTVRFLLDGADAQVFLRKSMYFPAFRSHKNVQVRFYNPLRPVRLWSANYRLHEKYLIIDDNVYLLGGRNLSDLYLSENAAERYSDRDVLVYVPGKSETSSLAALRRCFETVWAQPQCAAQPGRKGAAITEPRREMLARAAGLASRFGRSVQPAEWQQATVPAQGVTLLTGSPQARRKPPVLWDQLCRAMAGAQREILLQTPFVMGDRPMLAGLRQLCSAGISVQVVTNTPETCVNPLGVCYANQRGALMETGAEVYEVSSPTPMHEKTILIDDRFSLIGSFNLDSRSLYLDTEVMLLIDCMELNRTLRGRIDTCREKSRRVSPNGDTTYYDQYLPPELGPKTAALYAVLKKLLRPFQYLL